MHRLLALGALAVAGVGVARVVPAAVSAGAPSQRAQAPARYVEVDTTRARRILVPACDRRAAPADVAKDRRPGDGVLTLRAGEGRRLLRVLPCGAVGVSLVRPAIEVLPLGAPRPATGAVLVVGARSRARIVVVPRCPADGQVRTGVHAVGTARGTHVAAAPPCSG